MTERLEIAKARALSAREVAAAAGAVVARGREAKAAARADVEKLAGNEESWIGRHQRRVEEHIAAGGRGPVPTLAGDAKVQLAKVAADAQLRATTAAVETFERAHAAAAAALGTAERVLQDAANAALAQQGDELSAELTQLRERAEVVEASLRGLAEAGVPLSPDARVTLAEHGGDWTNIPLNKLGEVFDRQTKGFSATANVAKVAASAGTWRARRAALMAETPASVDAEAAA